MSVCAADLLKAINTVWDASALDATFKALWISTLPTEFPVLHDGLAGGEQPFPYCVCEQSAGAIVSRMSAGANSKQHIRVIPFSFHIHARAVDGDDRTAKQIAATLAEEIMKVFGGHPTVSPGVLTLDNGGHLITQFENDNGLRTGEDEYQWIVNYLFHLDVPVAV